MAAELSAVPFKHQKCQRVMRDTGRGIHLDIVLRFFFASDKATDYLLLCQQHCDVGWREPMVG